MDQLFEHRDGGYFFPNTKVGLDNIVYLLRQDFSAEAIADSYPHITLDQVQRAIDFYRANQAWADAWLELSEREEEKLFQPSDPELFQRLELARAKLSAQR
ncbi:MAG: DUF433 domain-containing protein [Bryobacteraceae bacterium]